MKKILNKDSVLLSMILLVGLTTDIFAQGSNKATSFMDGLVTFLIYSVGPGVITVAFIIAGLSFARSEQEGIRKAIQVFVAGAFITLSTWISDLIFTWS